MKREAPGPNVVRTSYYKAAATQEPTGTRQDLTAATVPSWLANLSSVSWRLVAVAALAVVVVWVFSIFWIVVASVVVAALITAVFAPQMVRRSAGGTSRNKAALLVWAEALLIVLGLPEPTR